ncbi:hypothetical protein [Lentzea sp. HUAS12]|uniref:hypothetical protein n=1 Tax=Lentzea sp. HUAS12 TaxID=2951806 RepID=UPI00209F5689|nr:hypothetical protein [Lentzea sp. HUAS12]USX56431.1 hypothetical protein ND450_20710 [Lentzea sp. HUAS12]
MTELAFVWTILRARIELARRDSDAGYVSETTLITALLVSAGVAVLAIIVAKVIAKATSIEL